MKRKGFFKSLGFLGAGIVASKIVKELPKDEDGFYIDGRKPLIKIPQVEEFSNRHLKFGEQGVKYYRKLMKEINENPWSLNDR